MIRIRFICGHAQTHAGDGEPRCGRCGHTTVARVEAPPPRITGWAEGPYVTTNLRLAPVGPEGRHGDQ